MPRYRRKRYLIFTLISNTDHSAKDVESALVESMKKIFGDLGLAMSGFKFMFYDEEKNTGIVRCWHKYTDHVRASIMMIKELKGTPAMIYVRKMTGTFKKAKRIVAALPKP